MLKLLSITTLALSLAGVASHAQGIPVDGSLPINVEIDYMVGSDHTHKPTELEIDALVQMFACRGIVLNVVVDDPIPEVTLMQCPDTSQNFWSCVGPQSFAALKSVYADSPATGWHYCIFGHQYTVGDGTSSSGYAEIGGNDLVVTLGAWPNLTGTPFDKAATFAHELGHNLGLGHWSPDSIPGFMQPLGAYAPNYASIMSYQYQLEGVASQLSCLGLVGEDHRYRNLDYSTGRLPDLNEVLLSETLGVGIHPVDWDCDGLVDSNTVARFLDEDAPWCGVTGLNAILDDRNDWANLIDTSWFLVGDTEEPERPSEPCLTYEQVQAMRSPGADAAGLGDPTACAGSAPTLSIEPCAQGLMIWATPGASGSGSGTGESPFGNVTSAVAAATDGSVLYLQPGTIGTLFGTSIVIDRELVLTGPGTAVISP